MAYQSDIISSVEWRDIPGWEGLYQASSAGLVRSCDRAENIRNRWGPITRVKKGRVLRSTLSKGYQRVVLCDNAGKRPYPVHRLVCLAWHGPAPFVGAVVAHGDGDKANNSARNLRWTNQSDNLSDMVAHGTRRQGTELWHVAKLTESDVKAIRVAAVTTPVATLSRIYNVSGMTIRAVIARKTWKHI